MCESFFSLNSDHLDVLHSYGHRSNYNIGIPKVDQLQAFADFFSSKIDNIVNLCVIDNDVYNM